MIFFAELQMQGDKHVQVNSGLLNVFKLAFERENVKVFCDSRHKDNLTKNLVNLDNISFAEFSYSGDTELRKKKMAGKLFREVLLAFKIFNLSKKQNVNLIIFFSVFPFTGPFIKLFAILFRKQVIMCMHGDIGVLRIKRNRITTVLFKAAIKIFFLIKSKYATVLFYGDSIFNKLFKSYPKFYTKNIISIDHPYNYDCIATKKRGNGPIIISNIGTGLMQKNSHLFYELADLCRAYVLENKINFIQVGNVATEVLNHANKYVHVLNNNQFIPIESFESHLLKSDYFIYFFTEGSLYDFCPSGTFFDAIKYKKPIIALRNPFFEHYFARLGNIGYLCDSLTEMQRVIDVLVNGDNENYESQIERLNYAADILSQKNISAVFKEQAKKYVDGD